MCGIFGVCGCNLGMRYVMEVMRFLNKERCGDDSWGIAGLSTDNEFLLYKGLGKVRHKDINFVSKFSRKTKVNFKAIIGHVRKATNGDVTLNNAHPFLNEDWTMALAHNGIIEIKIDERKHTLSGETDSERILHRFEEHYKGRISAPLRKTYDDLSGWANLVMLVAPNRMVVVSDGHVYTDMRRGLLQFSTEPLNKKTWVELGEGGHIVNLRERMVTGTVRLEKKYNYVGAGAIYSSNWDDTVYDRKTGKWVKTKDVAKVTEGDPIQEAFGTCIHGNHHCFILISNPAEYNQCDLCDTALGQFYCDECAIMVCENCKTEHLDEPSNVIKKLGYYSGYEGP